MKMFVQHLQTPPIPPSERTEMPIPREVDELVLACLEKDPSRRPQNADELLGMLDRCRSIDAWDRAAASAWWEKHLVELSGPLSVTTAQLDVEAPLVWPAATLPLGSVRGGVPANAAS
jgi:hypothetical protein